MPPPVRARKKVSDPLVSMTLGPPRVLARGSSPPSKSTGKSVLADRLIVRGAREHNLRDVSLDLPRDALIVFTGLSGSGKSSLAFDTIFAEGQRRYVESLSAYAAVPRPDGQARRRLHRGSVAGRVDRPEVGLAQPPVHRGHHHRGLRLPPVALCPGRAPALPGVRPANRPTDTPADRRPDPRVPRRHPVPGAGAGRPRPQRRIRRALPRAVGQGLRASAGRRAGGAAHRATDAEAVREAHHRGGRRPADGEAVRAAARRRLHAGSGRDTGPRAAASLSSSSTSSTSTRPTRTASAPTPSTSPASTTTCPSRSSSRGPSRSTRRTARAPTARASAPAWRSTPSWSFPTPISR